MKKLKELANKMVEMKNKLVEKVVAGDSHFVAVLVTIVVVVAIGFVFKDQLIAMVKTVIGTTTTKVTGMF